MTALAVVCREDAIVMASDGALVDESGIVVGRRSKVTLFPSASTIIGFRGHCELADVFLPTLHSCVNFDGILFVAGELLKITIATFNARKADRGDEPVYGSFLIGGYSVQRDGFEIYRLGSREHATVGQPTIPPFTLAPLSGVYAAPAPSPEACSRFGVTWNGSTLEDDSHLVLRLISAARSEQHEPFGGGKLVRDVGAFLQLTVLKQGMVDSRIVHAWPEAPGEKIDPTRGDALPAFLDPGKIARNESRYAS
jgi:hypothetical protein